MADKVKNKRFVLRVTVLVIIALALGGALISAFMNDDTPVRVGEPAPDFRLDNVEGDSVRLSDFEGQGVFINFWATWCGPCREEMPDIQAQYEVFKDQGVEVLAVNIAESELAASRFAERLNLTFPILLDHDRTVTKQFEVGDIPSSFFIGPEGNVVDKHTGILTEDQIKAYMEKIRP